MKPTHEEREINSELGRIAIRFFDMEQEHSADIPDFEFHIHALQNIVLARVGLRAGKEDTDA